MSDSRWTLTDHDYFAASGLSALVFHNTYPEGKQGGVEIIQHDERVASCGDLRLGVMPGQWDALPEAGERVVASDPDGVTVSVPLHFVDAELHYTVRVRPEGDGLRVSVDLTEPLPDALVGKVGFNLELYPGAYFGTTFILGATQRLFPRQANGPVREAGGPLPLASGAHLIAAPAQPLRRLDIRSATGTLHLYDGRDGAQNGWFIVREVAAAGATTDAVVWTITPNSVEGWRRTPVICVSQVGYHPDQVKHALVELDPRTETLAAATLLRLDRSGWTEVLAAQPARWGRFLRYEYAVFDFTAVESPGMYAVRYGDVQSPLFAIDPAVYRHDVWQPTLETYFPVQMCHVTVRDRYRVWHGACHLDDALQAPVDHVHFDGYRQYAETETPYVPYEHIPHLNRGGWHDAGDYDLAAGSQAHTTHTLALIRELFGIDTDQTTVDPAQRLVVLHTPDGVPDIVEQVAHGVENLLGGYRAAGHSFHGIIANSLTQYVHLGDACTMTDNVVADPALGAEADDRWAFTNHDTALEYLVAGALAASSRVLADAMPDTARECLTTATRIWETEHSGDPVEQHGGYVPRGVEAQEVLAAVELLLATGESRYRDRLVELWPIIEAHPLRLGGAAARALAVLDETVLYERLREALKLALDDFETELEENPFGIHFAPRIWGIGWQLLGYAVQLYQLWTAFPDLVDRELILRVVNYNLGCHPASNVSLASGVGAQSMTVAYGVNRADWSYIPGGVPSGPALIRPDFPELKDPWPFLWQQTEYVMSGAANYIFCVLAADAMLNDEGGKG